MMTNRFVRRGLSARCLQSLHQQPLMARVVSARSFSESSTEQRSTDPKKINEDFNYCVNLVRERDREGFLCGLLMPKKSQRAFFALRAFNVELASVKGSHNLRKKGETGGVQDSTSTIALQIRMQWWKDALGEIYGEQSAPPASDPALQNLTTSCWNSPIVRALDNANQEVGFTRRFLDRLIDSRALDLEVLQLATLDESINYAEDTVSSLLYLTLETVGVRKDEVDDVASYAGIGIGLTTLLRATPFRLIYNEVPIPAELLRATFPFRKVYGEENTLSESEEAEWKAALVQMATAAGAHLEKAKELQTQIPRGARPVFLPMIPSLQFLERLEGVQHNLMDAKLYQPLHFQLMLRLGQSWLFGRIK
eukprot:scaffold11639_cov172-Amphora_coffeaeformis.AAC.21